MIRLPADAPPGPVLAHTDARRTHELVRSLGNRTSMLAGHTALLRELADGRDGWVPTFTYDYCRTGKFSVDDDPSQVGPITEAFRHAPASWRSTMPVFSFAGTGDRPAWAMPADGVLDPFDEASGFADLVAADGTIVWYGAPFSSTTMIHHVEHLAGRPPYRYDKWFPGTVTADGDEHATRLRYHVRPLGRDLEYAWDRLEGELADAGIVHELDQATGIRWAPVRPLVAFWLARLAEDPLHLLDTASWAWVGPELDRLGRRFELADFEPPQAPT